MTVYIGFKQEAFTGGWEVTKVFDTEEKAKEFCSVENSKVFQKFDSYGLVDGVEYGYFAKEVE